MTRRIGLAQLMAFVAILAIGLAAMRTATATTARVATALALVALLIGTLGALVRRPAAAWSGFALFGWAFALAALLPSLREALALERLLADPLEAVLAVLHPPMTVPTEPSFGGMQVTYDQSNGRFVKWSGSGVVGTPMVPLTSAEAKTWDAYQTLTIASFRRDEAAEHAARIGYSALGLVFALLGAAAGHALQRPRAPTAALASSSPLDEPGGHS